MIKKTNIIINPYKNFFGKTKTFLEKKFPKLLENYILPINLLFADRLFFFSSKKIVSQYLDKEIFPIFQTIEIETINRCNGTCSFCPINRKIDPRPYKLMDEFLFYSIIEQLKDLNYEGYLGLYSNNEPLLDKRIISFLKQAKESLPNAKLYLFTNGSLLTLELFKQLMIYIDWITIDNYNDNLVLNEPIKKIYEYARKLPYSEQKKVHIYLRKENEILLNRGGQAKNRTTQNCKMKSACLYPFEQVIIRPDGKLSLCCNDALGKITMGDLTNDLLIDIWRSNEYRELRKTMLLNRAKCNLCKYCDTITPKMPHGFSFKIKNIFSIFIKKDSTPL